MPLRFVQVYLPADTEIELDQLLGERERLASWRDCDDSRRVIQLLVPADETEPIIDRFEERFAHREGFRVVLLPVEAVAPREKAQENGEVESEESVTEEVRESGRISREELYDEATQSLGVNRVYLAMTLLSTLVAALGLIRDDTAVIIGAMVIAPLLGPNVAMALAVTLGDLSLLRRSLMTNLAGVLLAFVFSLGMGILLPLDSGSEALAARTEVGLSDILLALAAGSAGTFAFTRGISGAVIGVMVAVALMPPLVTCGLCLGEGEWGKAFGALLLVGTNVICINLAGVATFVAQGVRPRSWWEEERARKATRIALLIWLTLLAALAGLLWVSKLFT